MIVLIGILLLVVVGVLLVVNLKKGSYGHYKRASCKKQDVGVEIEIKKVNQRLSISEKGLIDIENKFRKEATQLKKEKKYDQAIECLIKAREAQYKTDMYWSIDTLLRIPQYLMLAKRYKEAYQEALLISEFKWSVLGMIDSTMELTKAHLRYQALEIAYKAACKMNDSELIVFVDNLLRESLLALKKVTYN